MGSPVSHFHIRINWHSFRIEAVMMATSQRVADSGIKFMGRWSEQSTSYSLYIIIKKHNVLVREHMPPPF